MYPRPRIISISRFAGNKDCNTWRLLVITRLKTYCQPMSLWKRSVSVTVAEAFAASQERVESRAWSVAEHDLDFVGKFE